jgi:signal transduction histidine kinase/ligand-binding sensor domain-containing protein/DNA-binding response OmpR family regulator
MAIDYRYNYDNLVFELSYFSARMKHCFVLAIFLFLNLSLYAQTVRVINLKDGLSNNYVQCILQDRYGYIWMGTRDGLNRYNGHQIEVYKDQLPSTFIYSLMEDSQGKIWIGTSYGGVSIYDPEKESFELLLINGKTAPTLLDKDVYTIFEGRDHSIWLGTLQGLAHISNTRDTIVWFGQHTNGFDHSFTSILEDQNKTLWLGTNKGLYTIDPKSSLLKLASQFNLPSSAFIHDIKEDTQGNVWMATDEDGILKLNRNTNTITTYATYSKQKQKNNPVWKLYVGDNGILWAALINGGIYYYDEKTNRFVSYQSRIASAFNSESITDIIKDFNGNIWITSHGDGACYFNPNKYVFEKYLTGQSAGEIGKASVVSSFLEDSKGDIWVGTDGDGLKKISKKNIVTTTLNVKDGLSSNIILDIIEDDDKGKWLATWQGGVDYVNASGKKIQVFDEKNTKPFGLRMSNVKALLKDSASNIWMVSHGAGISVYDTKNKNFIDPQKLTPGFKPDIAQWGSDILQSKTGDVWIASHAGLFRYSGNQLQQYYATKEPNALSSQLVYCLFEDSQGTIWAGTNTSLEKYVPEKNGFENYTAKYNIPGNIKCILEDAQHRLWISAVNEIVAFDPSTNSVRHFDLSYNIQQGQFYECACLKSSTGKMFFGGTEGFNAFYPDSLKADQLSSRVLIINLYLFNTKQKPGDKESVLQKSMSLTQDLELTHAQNVVSFEFLALNYSSFDKNYYSYKMEGFDKAWSPVSESRMATYTNLDPGDYQFKVRTVSRSNTVLSETFVHVKIVPPFWQTSWFKLLAFLALILSITGFFLLRLQASKNKRIVLQQLVAERTREVSDKNQMLEIQKEDLQKKNDELIAHEIKISEQANVLAEQKEQLLNSNTELEDLNTTKDRLFSIIAHDLRNPFTSVLGFSRLLSSDFDRYNDHEKKTLIRNLYHSSSSIYSLLENLLVWSKAQQNILVFTPEKLHLKEIVAEHFDLLKDDAEKKNVSLILKADYEVTFFADRNMLNIIIRNLLSNALKYSPIDGRIEVGYELKGLGLEIYVKDEGSGIEKGIKLFEINAGDERHRDHNHGLGLILCKEFVEKHGGQIAAGNNEGRGARFSFSLPLSNAVVEEDFITHDLSDQNFSAAAQPMSNGFHGLPIVLIAEDDDQIRWYIKQILFPDFQVIEAVNGADAIALTNEKTPDIIISDLMMPKVDGLEFCKTIKSNTQTSHTPFIMLTAERSSDKKVSGFEFGADDYITKPIEPNVLRARLHNILENRRQLKSIYQRDIAALPETFTTNTVDQAFLENLNQIIENQIANPDLNPDHLAREVHMSRTGLYMKVKALTGESVGIYIRNIRLKESKKLLRERKLNISEVAYAVGFNQLPYFTTCFKEAFGMTPSEFISGKNT